VYLLLRAYHDIGIVLLAFGGPGSIDDVEPFLGNVLTGRPVLPALVDEVRERYRLIGGRSPLLEITKRQAHALHLQLLKSQHSIEVHVGMRHWHPYIHETLNVLAEKGVKRILGLMMAPFATKATAASYQVGVNQGIKQGANAVEVHYAPSWHLNPLYINAVVAKVEEGLTLFVPHRQKHVHMVFTAHSLPLTAVENDPYVDQIKTTIEEVMKRFNDHSWSLAFQSQGKKGGAWLSPNVEGVLESLAKRGKREVLVVPLGFVADHLEILYDLDIVLAEKANDLELVLHRSPSLNDSPQFIAALADIALTSLGTIPS
jgi:ferrochelatase